MVDVPNGEYTVSVRWLNAFLDRRIARARVYRSDCKTVTLGPEIGEVSVDVATIGICDINALDKAVNGKDDEFQDHIESYDIDAIGDIKFNIDGEIHLIYLESGYGDGGYPAHSLLSEDQIVGMEVEFISEAEPR